MPERSSVAQVSQIGVETTPGTAVPATKRLGSMSITPSIQAEAEMFRPTGLKFPTVQVLNKEWANIDVSGKPVYDEVVYPLTGAVNAATVSQVMDSATPTGAYEWVFTPSTTAADAPKTFTLESGQSGVQAEQFTHALFTAFGISVSRSEVSMTGSGFARRATAGHTPTGGLPVPSDLKPMAPGQFSVYLADTQAALSTGGASDPTKRLNRIISANPSIEDRYNPAWFVNGAEASFATFVENPDGAGGSFGLTMEADGDGMAWLNRMRVGSTHFLRLEAKGENIYNAGTKPNLTYLFQWDMAVKVVAADAWADEDGIYAIPWTLQPVHDTTWGKSQSILVRNKQAAL